MPTYEYACKECGEHLEVVQSFKDEPLQECPACGGPLRKVFGSIGIVFKGSGFYRTDSRMPAKSEAKADSAKSDSDKADSAKSDSTKSDAGKGDSAKSDSGKSDSATTKSGETAKAKSTEKTA